jgi:hypothetical protein
LVGWIGKRSTNTSSPSVFVRAGVVEVPILEEAPAIPMHQRAHKAAFVAFVKAYWTRLRPQFWTGITCVKDRYASFKTHLYKRRLGQVGAVQRVSAPCPDLIGVPVSVSF